MDSVQVTHVVTLNNITQLYFENLIVGLYVLYILNMYANFHINHMLFNIRSINSYFIHYFKLQKLDFKQLIYNMTINFLFY